MKSLNSKVNDSTNINKTNNHLSPSSLNSKVNDSTNINKTNIYFSPLNTK
jgi:hypothetical protein